MVIQTQLRALTGTSWFHPTSSPVSYLTVKRWSLRPWMRFLLIILNPSGYDNTGPDIPKSRRLAVVTIHLSDPSELRTSWNLRLPLQFFFQHTFTQEGDIWLIQSENAANIIWREFFLDEETLFTTFPQLLFPNPFCLFLGFHGGSGLGAVVYEPTRSSAPDQTPTVGTVSPSCTASPGKRWAAAEPVASTLPLSWVFS